MTRSPETRRTRHARRPRRSQLLAFAFVGVILILGGRTLYRRATRTPAPVVDYAQQIQQLSATNQPEGDDGWASFVSAAESAAGVLGRLEAPGTRVADFGDALSGSFDPGRSAFEIDVVTALDDQGVFDTMAEAAACPRAVRPILASPPLLTSLQLPELPLFRNLARARVFSMRLAAERGDDAERVAAFEEVLGLGRAAASQSLLIERLVGLACIQMALDEIRFQLHEPLPERTLDPETGRALLRAMDRQLALPPTTMMLEGERCAMLDIVQSSFTDDGHGDGQLDANAGIIATGAAPVVTPGFLGRLRSMFLAGRAETTDLLNEYFDGMVLNAGLPANQRASTGFDPNAFLGKLDRRHTFVAVLVPAIGAFLDHEDHVALNIVGTRTLIALEIHRATHGTLPATLDALVPELLPSVPVDPFNGGPLIYRRSDATHSGVELYSTGADGVDETERTPTARRRGTRRAGRLSDIELVLERE